MSGLNEIIGTIAKDGQTEAAAILARADKEAEAILAAAKSDADASYQTVLDDTKKACERNLDAAKSGAEAKSSRALLGARVESINGVLDAVRKKIDAMNDTEYTALLRLLLLKYARKGEGVLVFSKQDAARIGTDFLTDVSDELAKKGATVAMSGEYASIPGGFILKYGDIEENCAIDALMEEKSSDLKDCISHILFSE